MKHVKLFEQFKNSLNEGKLKVSIPMNSVADFENAINDEFGKGMLKSANIVDQTGSRHYTFSVLGDDSSDISAIKNNILGESVNKELYEVESEHDEALTTKDKKVVQAFYNQKPLEGKLINTDGKTLGRRIGVQDIAKWDGSEIVIMVYKPYTFPRSTDVILRYMKKYIPSDLWSSKTPISNWITEIKNNILGESVNEPVFDSPSVDANAKKVYFSFRSSKKRKVKNSKVTKLLDKISKNEQPMIKYKDGGMWWVNNTVFEKSNGSYEVESDWSDSDIIDDLSTSFESVNEDMYDFARDIKSALGPRPSSGEVEQYLGRKLTKYEREAIFGGGSKKSFSSTTKKTVSKTEPWPVGKFKGKMWSELPSWYKKWAESKFNIK